MKCKAQGVPTCPGGSLRNSDEVASDLTRSEVHVCETHLWITTICHSVRSREKIVRHKYTCKRIHMVKELTWQGL